MKICLSFAQFHWRAAFPSTIFPQNLSQTFLDVLEVHIHWLLSDVFCALPDVRLELRRSNDFFLE